MRNVSNIPGRRVMHPVPDLRMRERKILFDSLGEVVGNLGLTGTDTHLRIATVGTIVARTCSLLFIVSGMQPQNEDGRTRMNNTRTDDPSVLVDDVPKAGTRENVMTH